VGRGLICLFNQLTTARLDDDSVSEEAKTAVLSSSSETRIDVSLPWLVLGNTDQNDVCSDRVHGAVVALEVITEANCCAVSHAALFTTNLVEKNTRIQIYKQTNENLTKLSRNKYN